MASANIIAMACAAAAAFSPASAYAQNLRQVADRSNAAPVVVPADLAAAARANARSDAQAYMAASVRQRAPARVAPVLIAMADTRSPFSAR